MRKTELKAAVVAIFEIAKSNMNESKPARKQSQLDTELL